MIDDKNTTDIKNEVSEEAVVSETAEEEQVSGKEVISYDDFVKLDITIGTIVSAEIVEDADKLLRLLVDIGEDAPRQIVSGIREYFEDIQFLVGKQCPFVTNLQPRTIRGLESKGMILAAEHDGVFSLLIPHNELPSGTRVN